jgi:hypothetical protein
MQKRIFSGPVQVEIQGANVLKFIGQEPGQAKYQVIGFQDSITVIDRRAVSLQAIDEVLKTGVVDRFASQFNAPATLRISKAHSKSITIELDESDNTNPEFMLWVAIGIQDTIPVYDYLFERLVPFGDNGFAFLALYRRSPEFELVPTSSVSMAFAS